MDVGRMYDLGKAAVAHGAKAPHSKPAGSYVARSQYHPRFLTTSVLPLILAIGLMEDVFLAIDSQDTILESALPIGNHQ